jgi:hypothetical protein
MSLTNKNEFIDTLVITIFTFFVFRFVSVDGGNFHHYFHRYYKMYRLLIVLSLNNLTIKISLSLTMQPFIQIL